jgi:DNA mismatch repair protein MutS
MSAVDAAGSAEGGPSGARASDTPALRQYLAAKREHPDCLVLFRLGDFFEIFGDDAVKAAPILGVVLTGRDFGKGGRMPMCGVPHHSLDGYARRLLDAGLKVAVCDQIEAARPGVKLVARRVVRVLTAGTLVEDALLDPGVSRRCAGIFPVAEGVGAAVLDFSTGECQLLLVPTQAGDSALSDDLARLETAEVVAPDGGVGVISDLGQIAQTIRPADRFDHGRGVSILAAAGQSPPPGESAQLVAAALRALGGVVSYGEESFLKLPDALLRPRWRPAGEVMELDAPTRRSLELVEPLTPGGKSLLRLVDRTKTSPGARRLRSWLQAPLTDLGQLTNRQRGVAELVEQGTIRAKVRQALSGCSDLDRLSARCVHGVAGPRDLQHLAATLERIPQLASILAGASSEPLRNAAQGLGRGPIGVSELLLRALVAEPPALARDGGFIRPGFDSELDQINEGSVAARRYISQLEGEERARTGIKALKVGYNRVFGYYLEVRGSSQRALPLEYIRRQTLAGAERYVTAELKEQETVVLSARERALHRELELLAELLGAVSSSAAEIGSVASALAEVDAIQGLAEAGVELGWVLPEIDLSRRLELLEGRHPLVEDVMGPGRFVPNDAVMDGETERIWLITGPNMAGKSTFLRQVALICLLGQVGSLVPCRAARWGLVDRIFTRVGAQDDLAGGRSTFMVEMAEMAEILGQATPRSLLVLDELGRGTSTYDGMSIAQAILEYLHDSPRVAGRVLFSTHYHELTSLERLPALRNYRAEVDEQGGEAPLQVTFLHTIVPGGADRSYGLNVAHLAGIPSPVVERAAEILASLELEHPVAAPELGGQQLSLPLPAAHPVVDELRSLRVDAMTPLEALQKISDWQRSTGDSK